jgi:hypothetical protein
MHILTAPRIKIVHLFFYEEQIVSCTSCYIICNVDIIG